MAAVMMQAHGTETMIVKDGNKYSADFRYKNVDYEQDEYNGRCYFLDTSNFNPHSHAGSDAIRLYASSEDKPFQSTLPRRE